MPIFNDIIIYIELSDNRQHNKNKSHVKQVNGGDKQPENEPDNKKAYDKGYPHSGGAGGCLIDDKSKCEPS